MSQLKPNHFISLRETRQIIRKDGRKYTIRRSRDRFFFPDEWKAFFDCLKNKQKVTFHSLINTGARIMELQNVKVCDIDFERNNIVLRVTKRVISNPGKVGAVGIRNIRVLVISTQFCKYLKKIANSYKLGPDDNLPILSTPAANIGMKKALIKAGIKDFDMFSVHNCRKTLENWLLALDVDSLKVVKHFGHSLAIAAKHYVSPDIFNWNDKEAMREIIGDLFQKRF